MAGGEDEGSAAMALALGFSRAIARFNKGTAVSSTSRCTESVVDIVTAMGAPTWRQDSKAQDRRESTNGHDTRRYD